MAPRASWGESRQVPAPLQGLCPELRQGRWWDGGPDSPTAAAHRAAWRRQNAKVQHLHGFPRFRKFTYDALSAVGQLIE